MKALQRTQQDFTRAVARALVDAYTREAPAEITTDDVCEMSAILLLRNGRSLKDLVSFSSVLLPGPVPPGLGLPPPDRLSWLLSAEIATFCPVPDAGWQALSREHLEKYRAKWRDTLRKVQKSCRRDRFLHVPFLAVLGNGKPEDWLHLDAMEVPRLAEAFDPRPLDSPEIFVLRRPFITWPVDGRQPRRMSRADRVGTSSPPSRFAAIREEALAAWFRFRPRDPYLRPRLDYRLFDSYIDEST